jgi:hypothetical protein
MVAVDVVLDFASHFLDQDFCDREEISCGKRLSLMDYLKVALTELKSAQQIIRMLHDEKEKPYNLKNQVSLSNATYRISEDLLSSKRKSTNVSHISENTDMVKHKIRIVGDSHARGLAFELKCNLTQEFESQGVVKPGPSLVKLVNTSNSDLKALTMSDYA